MNVAEEKSDFACNHFCDRGASIFLIPHRTPLFRLSQLQKSSKRFSAGKDCYKCICVVVKEM